MSSCPKAQQCLFGAVPANQYLLGRRYYWFAAFLDTHHCLVGLNARRQSNELTRELGEPSYLLADTPARVVLIFAADTNMQDYAEHIVAVESLHRVVSVPCHYAKTSKRCQPRK